MVIDNEVVFKVGDEMYKQFTKTDVSVWRREDRDEWN